MNDKELLAAAAKAAGMNVLPANQRWPEGAEGWFHTSREDDVTLYSTSAPRLWNPLTDDGDALRLMATLDLMVDCGIPGRIKCAGEFSLHLVHLEESYLELATANKIAATRRAIVRAAAAIGEAA